MIDTPVLIDSDILLRQVSPTDPLFCVADNALRTLTMNEAKLFIVPQTLHEFWVVATRSTTARAGLGWTTVQADNAITRLEHIYTLMSDNGDVFQEWRRLVASHRLTGYQAHNARLVAAMKTHHIHAILTFKGAEFARYRASENIWAFDPYQL